MKRVLLTLITGICMAQSIFSQAKPHPILTCRLPLPTQLSDSAKVTRAEVLYVIDGVPESGDVFQRLDVDDIETIDVLKEAATTTFISCRRGNADIIVVTTNRMYTWLQVVDSLNGQAIPYASITIKSNNTKADQILAADSNGLVRISRHRLQKIPSVVASSVSYITKQVAAPGLQNYPVISLQRKAAADEAVTVTAGTIQYRKRTSCGGTSVRRKQLTKDAVPGNGTAAFKAYPNPVQKGMAVTIQLNDPALQKGTVQLLSASGQAVGQWHVSGGEGGRTLQVPVDTRYAPGMYILVLKTGAGKVLSTFNLVIQ